MRAETPEGEGENEGSTRRLKARGNGENGE